MGWVEVGACSWVECGPGAESSGGVGTWRRLGAGLGWGHTPHPTALHTTKPHPTPPHLTPPTAPYTSAHPATPHHPTPAQARGPPEASSTPFCHLPAPENGQNEPAKENCQHGLNLNPRPQPNPGCTPHRPTERCGVQPGFGWGLGVRFGPFWQFSLAVSFCPFSGAGRWQNGVELASGGPVA